MSYPKGFKQYGFRVGEGSFERRYKFEHDERQMFILRESIDHKQSITEPPDSIYLPWSAWVDLAHMIVANETARIEAATPNAAELFEACAKASCIEAKYKAFLALKEINLIAAIHAGFGSYKQGESDRLHLIAELLDAHGSASKSAWEMMARGPKFPFESFLGALERAEWAKTSWKQQLLEEALAHADDGCARVMIDQALRGLGR